MHPKQHSFCSCYVPCKAPAEHSCSKTGVGTGDPLFRGRWHGQARTHAQEDLVEAAVPLHGNDAAGHAQAAHQALRLCIKEDDRAALAASVRAGARQDQALVGAPGHLQCACVHVSKLEGAPHTWTLPWATVCTSSKHAFSGRRQLLVSSGSALQLRTAACPHAICTSTCNFKVLLPCPDRGMNEAIRHTWVVACWAGRSSQTCSGVLNFRRSHTCG